MKIAGVFLFCLGVMIAGISAGGTLMGETMASQILGLMGMGIGTSLTWIGTIMTERGQKKKCVWCGEKKVEKEMKEKGIQVCKECYERAREQIEEKLNQ